MKTQHHHLTRNLFKSHLTNMSPSTILFQKYIGGLWWSVLLVEETRVTGKNHRLATSH